MARVYVFGDEAGNFDFSSGPGGSKFFMIGTVALKNPEMGSELLAVRRDLAHRGEGLQAGFHAAEDPQAVRNEVFAAIQRMTFRFDITILDKRKALPKFHKDPDRFYKQAWFLHFKFICPKIANPGDELLVVAASIGTKRKLSLLRAAIQDVVSQSSNCKSHRTAFWSAASDPCLVLADYCTWAVQRKYEREDDRSYKLLKGKIFTEFQPFSVGTKTYY